MNEIEKQGQQLGEFLASMPRLGEELKSGSYVVRTAEGDTLLVPDEPRVNFKASTLAKGGFNLDVTILGAKPNEVISIAIGVYEEARRVFPAPTNGNGG